MATNKPKIELKAKARDEYTVGWVYALPKEQTAAIAMLDESHATVPKPANDPNSYSLGSIGEHNVVIACLPKGQTGNYSAATVATWMVSTFPRIKFGFMVGIGGGIPSKVRLGDVVISAPTGKYSGVVQWDMGRAESGRFQRTGSLNNPPTLLLTALTTLESYHEMNEPRIFEYLDKLKEKWPRLAPKYLRSESLKDVLFKADYDHVNAKKHDDEDDAEEDEKKDCKTCNPEKVVKRNPRETRVHHGLIVSGSLVVKDGVFRNSLNKYFDNEVLCIEMEAAGLMNNFPCLVIRGISDYADSHKNDSWQEHAAAMAAACAKELLQHVVPADVEKEPPAKEVLDDIVKQLVSITEMSEEQKILTWLVPNDHSVQQNKYIKMHEKGTGQWFLESAEFMAWIETKRQILFCPGIPGAGKTILAALAVQNLCSRFAHDPKVGIAYTYFNFWKQEEQSIEDLFAGMIKQLTENLSPLPASLKALFDDHKGKGLRPPFDRVSNVLQSIIRISYERVFIVVDALDECQEFNDCRMRFIEALFGLQKWGANILATSRPLIDITDKFSNCTRLEVRASDDDIRTYVNSQISHRRSQILLDMRAEASAGIAKAADGMFLLAKLDLDSLLDAKLPKDVKEILKNLPKGSEAYRYAYEGIMKRIEHQGPKSVKFAKSVLGWITYAKRPLIASELQHALAVEIGSSKFNEEDVPQFRDVVSVCAGLVTVDEDSNVIRLSHYTAQEYFEQTQKQWFPHDRNDIAKICITYLSYDTFETGFSLTDTAFETRLQSFQLYDYAAHNWGHHARESTTIDQLIVDFLMKQTKVEASSQALFAIKQLGKLEYSQDVPKRARGLHLVAYFGLEKIVQPPLDLYGWDPEDDSGRTPLSWAAENGHEAIVRLLLAKGANSRAKDHSTLLPVSWAAMSGHDIIVRLLDSDNKLRLDDIANDARRKMQKYRLMRESVQMIKENEKFDKERQRQPREAEAITTRLEQIKDRQEQIDDEIRKLQRERENLKKEERDKTQRLTSLSKTQTDARRRQDQLSEQWINTQTQLDELRQTDGYKHESKLEKVTDSVLFRWAVEDGYTKIVESLLCGGTDATVTNEDGWLPLHTAASKGYVDLVGLLIDTGKVQVNSEDNDDRTALQVAIEKGHQDVIHLLLGKGAVESRCQQTFKGHTGIVESLAFSHNSKRIASGSSDNTIKIWDIAAGKCQQTLKGHSDSVVSVAFSHNSKLIASGSFDGTIKLWDTATGKCQQTLKGHNNWVCSITFSHDSKRIASGSWDKTIKIWDTATGKCQQTLKGHSNWVRSVAFSYNSNLIASGSGDETIKIWNAVTGECQQTLQGHSGGIYSITFSHDAKSVASGSGDRIIKIWNISPVIYNIQ